MFEKSYSSIFEQEDEFGLDSFREDFYAIFNMNKIKVQLIKPNLNNPQLQDDFMGVRTNPFVTDISIIDVCIQSQSPQKNPQQEEGRNPRGELMFTCYVPAEVDISSKYTIKFIENNEILGLKSGQEFRIKTSEFGFWKAQYGFKSFDIVAI